MPDFTYPSALLILISSMQVEIRTITSQLERGEMTLDEWKSQMRERIIRYALAALMLGMVDEELSAQAQAVAVQFAEQQNGYLEKFANEIKTGGEWQASWNHRAEQYGESIQVPYWKAATRFLVLPAYPGDGSSECMVSDRCMWFMDWIDLTNRDVDAYWVNMHDARICPTCAERGIRWYPLRVRGGFYSA
jgi:hypothetical protein